MKNITIAAALVAALALAACSDEAPVEGAAVAAADGFDMGDAAVGYVLGSALAGSSSRPTVNHYYPSAPVVRPTVRASKPVVSTPKVKVTTPTYRASSSYSYRSTPSYRSSFSSSSSFRSSSFRAR